MIPYSFLDLVPVLDGGTVSQALADAATLAAHAEALGFTRYWVAEHHGMPGIASAATSVVIGHLAAATSRMRVGAGGIMLPNHAPMVIAEQFGTLDALYPGRIDLGLGRAPGSDQRVARALRRTLETSADAFPQDVLELQSLFADDGQTGIHATPGGGADVALWILGSSTYGAQLAAMLGLPYAFASHFAPAALDAAAMIYKRDFRPSNVLEKPHFMPAFNVIAADTDAEAEVLATSQQQAFVAIRTTGTGIKLPPPLPGYRETLPPQAAAMLDQVLECTAIGSPETVARGIAAFIARTGADEIILTSSIYDQSARQRSLTIAAEVMRAL
ncbi:LLM class flavin-dependent oxidoreductase [Sphingomonas donggukensis]|uniref:LLM class flavin-dependent oxidoreductase n=1 Tax=Sphingomonas donggukensis TaxID=2949093 RepID=A0ABY4TYI8_9SPHN|nr:LLM class flavin-dependent oxidoreductase [Sphingomonas donggukensis]URW75373.1 LLM class flavin-dependent oxidoreductase [Sphingomonas donggukensis]